MIAGGGAGLEDGGAIAVPVTITLADTDGSEVLTRVEIGNVPAGAVLGWNTALPGSVTPLGGGSFRFEGSQAEIAALLASLTLTPALHSDADVVLSVAATVTETSPTGVAVPTATRIGSVTVAVTAIADAPVLTAATVSGEEDTAFAFGGAITISLPDADGSESISRVEISGLPAGWTLAWNAALAGAVAATPSGAILTGTEAEIRALLASFTATPPAHADADATLTVAVTSRDNDGSTATSTITQTLIVDAQADAPVTITTPQSVTEDGTATIGTGIGWTLTDNDGSEWVSSVSISGLPAGWVAALTPAAGVTITGDAQSGFVVSIGNRCRRRGAARRSRQLLGRATRQQRHGRDGAGAHHDDRCGWLDGDQRPCPARHQRHGCFRYAGRDRLAAHRCRGQCRGDRDGHRLDQTRQ